MLKVGCLLCDDYWGTVKRRLQLVISGDINLAGCLGIWDPARRLSFADLSQRVDSVKEESLKLRSENQVLGQYIQNLMSSSSVFQSAQPKATQAK